MSFDIWICEKKYILAMCCDMDIHEAKIFDPDLELERIKTLIMGDDRYNHRYI
jgi:hypothetical protein